MNALSAELVDRLLQEVLLSQADGTRLLVLRGEGRNFSAGFDFSDFENESEASLLLRFVRIEELLQAVHHAPFDTLALAHGPTMGAGADLVCACARRIAAPGAKFRMPGLKFGLVLGTRRLAARVGGDAARDVLGATRTFDAPKALASGFITGLAPQDEWCGLIEVAAKEAAALEPRTSATLFSRVTPDTRDADMADLVRSAAFPGIKTRLKAYFETLR